MKRRERLEAGEKHADSALGLLDRAAALFAEKLARLRKEGEENGPGVEDELERTWSEWHVEEEKR